MVGWELWLLVAMLALALGAVLSSLVQSLRDVSRGMLEEVATRRGGAAGKARAERIMNDLEGHAAAIALPRTACNLFVALALVMWITTLRGQTAPTWPDLLIAAFAASFLLWVFGVILPTSVAKHAGESVVYAWSPVLRGVYVAARPFAAMARGTDEVVRRLSGRQETDAAQAVQNELLTVVQDATVEGTVDQTERNMIEAVVRFRDKTAGQIMTPRTEIEAMELCDELSALTAMIRRIGHSRIPVYEGSVDHIVGIFYVKDLMKWLAGESARTGKVFSLRALLRPAHFVPESKTVRQLLTELLAKRTHVALVADEYGGTAGLVTIEDIVEEVFGEIQDEYEEPESENPEVKLDRANHAAEIDARAYIRDANDALSPLGVELPESEDYDTVGGFVTVTLGRIPPSGERFTHDGLEVTVLQAEPTRVTRVRVMAERPAVAPAG